MIRALCLYDWPEDFDMASHPRVLLGLVNALGSDLNKISFHVADEQKLRHKKVRNKDALTRAVSGINSYNSIGLFEIPGQDLRVFESCVHYSNRGWGREYFAMSGPLKFELNDMLKQILLFCEHHSPQYGFSHVKLRSSGAYSFSCGIAATSLTTEESQMAHRLDDMIRRQKAHRIGKLLDVFELNVLAPVHLENRVGDTSLANWIAVSSGKRGGLIRVKPELHIWLVPEDVRDAVRRAIDESGLIFGERDKSPAKVSTLH